MVRLFTELFILILKLSDSFFPQKQDANRILLSYSRIRFVTGFLERIRDVTGGLPVLAISHYISRLKYFFFHLIIIIFYIAETFSVFNHAFFLLIHWLFFVSLN